MKHIASVMLVLSLFWLGGERGNGLKRRAERTRKLAMSLTSFSHCIENRGMLALEALDLMVQDPDYIDLEFYSAAAEKCSAGTALSVSLAKSVMEWEHFFSDGAAVEAARLFEGLGKTSLHAETEAIRHSAEKLYSMGEAAVESAAQLKKLYRSLYAIAGAAAAVVFM